MSSVLLISNTYQDMILVHIAKYIFNIEIKKIILLREYHHNNEFQNTEDSIHLCNSIEEAIGLCDITIAFIDQYKKQSFKKRIADICSILNKKLYVINNLKNSAEILPPLYKIGEANDNNVPIILVASLGYCSMTVCTEMLVHEIFTELDVKISYDFLPSTKQLLNCLMDLGIANNDLLTKNDKCDVIIKSVDLSPDNLFEENNQLIYQEITSLKPDYVILTVDNNIDEKAIKEVSNILKYRCESPTNFIIRSSFKKFFEDNISNKIIYISDNSNLDSNMKNVYLFHENIKEALKNDMLLKISLPNDVKIV